jgi:hypothetical protein
LSGRRIDLENCSATLLFVHTVFGGVAVRTHCHVKTRPVTVRDDAGGRSQPHHVSDSALSATDRDQPVLARAHASGFWASLVSLDRNGAYGLGIFVLEPDVLLTIPSTTVNTLEKSGLTNSIIAKLRTLADKEFKGSKELGAALKKSMSLAELEMISSLAGREMMPVYRNVNGRRLLAHSGEIGEYLLAMPGSGIAVSRTIDDKRGHAGDFSFPTIYRRVLNLSPGEGR